MDPGPDPIHAMDVCRCVRKSMAIDQRDGGREKNENYARSKTVKKPSII